MKAKALVCDAEQNFTLEDVLLKGPAPDQIAVRTHYTGVSIGTEFALVRNKISWGPYPLCTGYQGTGVVEEANGEPITRKQTKYALLYTGLGRVRANAPSGESEKETKRLALMAGGRRLRPGRT